MKDYLSLWLGGLKDLGSIDLSSAINVTGLFDTYLGHAHQYAKVEVRLEPAQNFEVFTDNAISDELMRSGYFDWAVFGLLDALVLHGSFSITNARIIIEGADYDRIDCSAMAFRLAGRDAGYKILTEIKQAKTIGTHGGP